jgi:hypothetical protein
LPALITTFNPFLDCTPAEKPCDPDPNAGDPFGSDVVRDGSRPKPCDPCRS